MSETLTLPVHPALDAIPRMPPEQLKALAESIQLHGLRQRIRRHQGVIIDGREREEACRLADHEPEYEDIEVDDPVAYILDANLRRNLSQSQCATVVIKACPGGRPSKKAQNWGLTRRQVAQVLGVSESLVDEAASLRKRSAALFEAVWKGELAADGERKLSISAAHAQLDAKEAEAGGAGSGKGKGEGEGGGHQLVCHMMRDIAKALACKQRTSAQTRETVARLRDAAPQMLTLADELERSLPEGGEDPNDLTKEQLAKKAGVSVSRLDTLLSLDKDAPPPDKDGKVRFTLAHVEWVKEANAKREAEKAKKTGGRKKSAPAVGGDSPTAKPEDKAASAQGEPEHTNGQATAGDPADAPAKPDDQTGGAGAAPAAGDSGDDASQKPQEWYTTPEESSGPAPGRSRAAELMEQFEHSMRAATGTPAPEPEADAP